MVKLMITDLMNSPACPKQGRFAGSVTIIPAYVVM